MSQEETAPLGVLPHLTEIGKYVASGPVKADTQAYSQIVKNIDDSVQIRQHGADTLRMLAGGFGTGAGVLALYHLAKAMTPRSKKETRYSGFAPGTPQIAGEKNAFDMQQVGSQVLHSIGNIPNALAKTISNAGPFGKEKVDPDVIRGPLATALQLTAGVGGLYGGKKLVDHMMAQKTKADVDDEVEEARRHYYDVLTGADKQSSVLDKCYDVYCTKTAQEDNIFKSVVRGYNTTALLSALAAATVGGKYMYDKTRERSISENLAKARAHRARMSALPAVWVDPEQVAQVKQLAEQHA